MTHVSSSKEFLVLKELFSSFQTWNSSKVNKGFIKLFTNSWWFQIVANGTIWTDTFFVLRLVQYFSHVAEFILTFSGNSFSGFLMAHSTADRYRRANLRASRAESIFSKAKIYVFEILQATSYRYLRYKNMNKFWFIWIAYCLNSGSFRQWYGCHSSTSWLEE